MQNSERHQIKIPSLPSATFHSLIGAGVLLWSNQITLTRKPDSGPIKLTIAKIASSWRQHSWIRNHAEWISRFLKQFILDHFWSGKIVTRPKFELALGLGWPSLLASFYHLQLFFFCPSQRVQIPSSSPTYWVWSANNLLFFPLRFFLVDALLFLHSATCATYSYFRPVNGVLASFLQESINKHHKEKRKE